MSVFTWPLQVAIKRALLPIAQCAGRVYDVPPQDVTFPWIEIGDSQIVPDDASAEFGEGSDYGASESIDLHVWGRVHAGRQEVKQIIDDIHSRMHGVDLGAAGRASALCWVRNIRVLIDPDGITVHGVVGLEIISRS